jgi:predicted metal-dependent phosphotriesterase family hydrolase
MERLLQVTIAGSGHVIQSLHEKGLPTDAIQTICIENQQKLLNISSAPPG